MAWRRFYIDRHLVQTNEVRIQGDLAHHIREVCRFNQGDQFELLPGDGRALLVEIVAVSSRELQTRIVSERVIPEPAGPRVVLCLSLPKLPKVDWIVEKCVELGVAEIRPFVSDYSFLRKVAEVSPNRLQRWEKLVQAATQQSGRGDRMPLHLPVTLPALLEEFNRKSQLAGLFLYEGEAPLNLREALQSILSTGSKELWVFVGSEGGFSQSEVEAFASVGLRPVSLGAQILRVETACVAIVSIIKYETGTLC